MMDEIATVPKVIQAGRCPVRNAPFFRRFEDAIVLADCVARNDLAGYAELRRKRTIAVQWASRRTADLMHLLDGAPDFRDIPSRLAWIHAHDALSRGRDVLARG